MTSLNGKVEPRAAPCLLKAVRELKELFRFALMSTTPEIARDGMVFIKKAEAAIAKATGQTARQSRGEQP